jgi:hypothetical protein
MLEGWKTNVCGTLNLLNSARATVPPVSSAPTRHGPTEFASARFGSSAPTVRCYSVTTFVASPRSRLALIVDAGPVASVSFLTPFRAA